MTLFTSHHFDEKLQGYSPRMARRILSHQLVGGSVSTVPSTGGSGDGVVLVGGCSPVRGGSGASWVGVDSPVRGISGLGVGGGAALGGGDGGAALRASTSRCRRAISLRCSSITWSCASTVVRRAASARRIESSAKAVSDVPTGGGSGGVSARGGSTVPPGAGGRISDRRRRTYLVLSGEAVGGRYQSIKMIL